LGCGKPSAMRFHTLEALVGIVNNSYWSDEGQIRITR
jgi:hypothetical protein